MIHRCVREPGLAAGQRSTTTESARPCIINRRPSAGGRCESNEDDRVFFTSSQVIDAIEFSQTAVTGEDGSFRLGAKNIERLLIGPGERLFQSTRLSRLFGSAFKAIDSHQWPIDVVSHL